MYYNMYRKLKDDGILMPEADLLIAATATANNALLKTGDEHFRRLKTFGLKLKE